MPGMVNVNERDHDEAFWAPGTVFLEDGKTFTFLLNCSTEFMYI